MTDVKKPLISIVGKNSNQPIEPAELSPKEVELVKSGLMTAYKNCLFKSNIVGSEPQLDIRAAVPFAMVTYAAYKIMCSRKLIRDRESEKVFAAVGKMFAEMEMQARPPETEKI